MKRNSLPRNFKIFFWDCNFTELNLSKHREFILERLLNLGTYDTFKWIFKNYKREEVISFIKKKGKIRLNRNSYLFWKFATKIHELWK